MHDERYANDVCIGEISIPLKKIQSFQELKQSLMNFDNNDDYETNGDNNNNNNGELLYKDDDDDIESNLQFQSNIYTLFPMKEIKGDLMVGICYLPTSRRVNITIIKGTIRNSILRSIDQSLNHQGK
ncbi:synaptotagmin-2-like protein [Euroglyphus maynei]|uniref:Synaptotagmin-2-like protein n=1 Tax=Euroglyphus maynei TaxID=6958 RepID=A0A1Y3BGG7_EURMA|nr:synaptotagmin-2-like protein [Euroglyphus maynei]